MSLPPPRQAVVEARGLKIPHGDDQNAGFQDAAVLYSQCSVRCAAGLGGVHDAE